MLAPRSIVSSVGAAWLAVTLASAAPAPVTWEPDPELGGTGFVDAGGWIDEGPGYRIRLRLVDEAERIAYLERATGHRIDPFATPPDREPRYLSFLLELGNASSSTLMFQSQTAWLMTGKEVLNPVGIEGLTSSARMVGLQVGQAYEKARPAVLENSIYVPSGESMQGLLVYRRFKPETKRFRVEMQFLLPNGELCRFVAPYRRAKEPPKAKKQKGS